MTMTVVMAVAIRLCCNEATIETHQKVIQNYRVFFHFTAPEAGGKPKPCTQQSNRERERFVPPGEEEDGVLLLPSMSSQFIYRKLGG